MTGIRNPKAHGNVVLRAEEATHMLFLASLLLTKFEAAKDRAAPKSVAENKSARLFMRLANSDAIEKLQQIKKYLLEHPGNTDALLIIANPQQAIRLPMGVKTSEGLIEKLENILGKGNVKLQ